MSTRVLAWVRQCSWREGKAAIILFRQIGPQVKALVSSGDTSAPVKANDRENDFSAVLSKLCRLVELSKGLTSLPIS